MHLNKLCLSTKEGMIKVRNFINIIVLNLQMDLRKPQRIKSRTQIKIYRSKALTDSLL